MIERFSVLNRSQSWLSAIVTTEWRFGAAKLASPRFSSAVEASGYQALMCAPGHSKRRTIALRFVLHWSVQANRLAGWIC
jgi:hypothetical protein